MNMGAGMAIGIAVGIPCGISSGRVSGQKEMGRRMNEHAVREGLTITTREGHSYLIEDLIAAGQDPGATGAQRKMIFAAVFIGLLVMLSSAVWVYFATRG